MNRNDEIRRTWSQYDAALDAIRRAKAGKANAGLEANLGNAYQRLVRLNAVPQLRWKYRG